MELILLLVFALVVGALGIKMYSRNRKARIIRRIAYEYGTIPESEMEIADFKSVEDAYMHLQEPDDIDAITWNDLDMDTLYKRINNTQSSMGDEWLYAQLHHQNTRHLETNEAFLQQLVQDERTRLEIQYIFYNAGKDTDNKNYAFLEAAKTLKIPDPKRFILQMLGAITGIVLLFIAPTLGFPMATVFILLNLVTYMTHRDQEYSRNLTRIVLAIQAARKLVKVLKQGGLEAEAETLKRILNPIEAIQKQSGFFLKSLNANENAVFMEGFNMIFLFSTVAYTYALKIVSSYGDALMDLYEFMGRVDGMIAIDSYRKSLDTWSKPIFTDSNETVFVDLVHPLLSNSENAVKNTRSMAPHMLYTGSNASGKSTFVKALAVNTLMGQTINTCTAASFKVRHAYIVTSMALRDSILSGKSYFIVELESLKRILRATETYPHCFVVVDEILRGTNTIERIASSSAILETLGTRDCKVCVATHDIELTQLLSHTYTNYHFTAHVKEDTIHFDYVLYDGPSTTTNAIKLLSHMHFETDIVEKATQRAETFRTTKTWK